MADKIRKEIEWLSKLKISVSAEFKEISKELHKINTSFRKNPIRVFDLGNLRQSKKAIKEMHKSLQDMSKIAIKGINMKAHLGLTSAQLKALQKATPSGKVGGEKPLSSKALEDAVSKGTEKGTKKANKENLGQRGFAGRASVTGAGFSANVGLPVNPLMGMAMVGARALVTRAQGGMKAYQESLPDRMRLLGKGISSDMLDYGSRNLTGMLMSPGTRRQAQLMSANAFGMKGGIGGMNQRVGNMQQMSLATGTDAIQNIGLGGTLRAAVGSERAYKDMVKLMSTSIAKGNKASIEPYLEASVSLLSSINENGVSSNEALINLMAVGRSKGMSPEVVARRIGTLDQAMRGGDEETKAFFMEAMANVLPGVSDMGSLEFATKMGIAGLDSDQIKQFGGLTKSQKQDLQKYVGPKHTMRAIRGIYDHARKLTQFSTGEVASQQQQHFLKTKTPQEASAVMGLMENVLRNEKNPTGKASQDALKKLREHFKNMKKSPEYQTLLSIKKSELSQEEVGKSLRDLTIKSNIVLRHIDMV